MKKNTLIILTFLTSLTLLNAQDYKVFPSYNLQAQGEDDAWHPMVGVEDGFPVIVIDRSLQPSADKEVLVKPRSSINDLSANISQVEVNWTDDHVVLNVEVSSSQPAEGIYAVLVYTPADTQELACKYIHVGEMSGEQQTLHLRFDNASVPREGWSLHFYQAGLEMYQEGSEGLKEATPRQAFSLALTRHLARAGTGDASPAPFYMPIPAPDASMLPEGDDPFIIKVRMEILANGTVDSFMFPEDTSPELQVFLTSRLGEWLFLPRIKEGKRVDQTVSLPIQLR